MSYPARLVAGDQLPAADLTDYTLNPKYTYGETIAIGEMLYLKASDGKAYKADADVFENVVNFIGAAAEAGVLNDTKYVVPPGKTATGLVGLTAGTVYYLSNTAGGVSTSEGSLPLVIGVAVSTTTILLAAAGSHKMTALFVKAGLADGTSGEAIAVGDALYLKASDGKLYKTDADADESTFSFTGIAQKSAAGADETIYFSKPGGIAKGLAGLTAGSYYYLSGTAGAISTTPGTRFAKVAQALSTTTARVIEPKFIVSGTQSCTSVTTFVQTTGFYPARIILRVGSAGAGGRIHGVSVGDDSSNCVFTIPGATATGNASFSTDGWSIRDDLNAVQNAGSVSAKSATGFTLNCSTHATNATVQWIAYSE